MPLRARILPGLLLTLLSSAALPVSAQLPPTDAITNTDSSNTTSDTPATTDETLAAPEARPKKTWSWGTSPDAVPTVKAPALVVEPAPSPTPTADNPPPAEPPVAQAPVEPPATEPPVPQPTAITATPAEPPIAADKNTIAPSPAAPLPESTPVPEDKAAIAAPATAEPVKEQTQQTITPAPTSQKSENTKGSSTAAATESPGTNAAQAVPKTGDPFVDALSTTYKANPHIKAERDRQKATDEGVAQALSGFRPTATANYQRGRQRTEFDTSKWSYSTLQDKGLNVEQPLFKGFGTIEGYRSAKQRVIAGVYQLSAVEQETLLQAISAYMDVVADTAILDLSRNNRDVLSKQLEASNERFNVGEVTRTDVAQSEARLSQAKTQVISSEGQLIASIASFERIVGYKPETTLVAPEHTPELPPTLQEALQQGRDANPQLLSAIHSAKSADYDVNVNKSVILPKVSLVGSMNRQDGAGVLGTSKFNQDSVTVQVSVPLYQSGAEYSRVRQAKDVARQRKQDSVDTGMAVDEAVTKSWEQLETAIDTIRTRQDQIKAAQVALEGVKQEQEYGARTILDVLDAEQELFTAKTNLIQAQRDRVVAAYNLLLNLGKLTPQNLNLPVEVYDPEKHYDDIKWLPFGF